MPINIQLRSMGLFLVINALFAMGIASRYFTFLPNAFSDGLGAVFIVSSTFSHMALLCALFTVVLLPLLLLPERLNRVLISAMAALALTTLLVDTIVFAQYRFHINAVVLELLLAGQIVSFPLITWLMAIGAVALVWLLQWWLLGALRQRSRHKRAKSILVRRFTQVAVISFFISNGVHIWAAAHAYQPVTVAKRYLPLFQPITANSAMRKQGWIDEEALAKQKALSLERKSDMTYPLAPLQTETPTQAVNILFLVIDSWRADTLSPTYTPNLWALAQKGRIYPQHFSTGNSTRTGIFGLFYGLPGTYWHGMLANRTSPLLITRLQELNYQMGIFAAAQLHKPEFDQTVFASIPNLRTHSKGERPYQLDQNLTDDWLSWYAQRDTERPSFSFLFYDAPHGYDFPDDYPHRFEPMLKEINYLSLNNDTDPTPFFNRYKTSVHYVDSQIKRVLDALKERGELENTLIVITGDHSQEMNDNRLNFWGHNGNFTDAQVKVPFALVGPGIDANTAWPNDHFTTHPDVVPTLMKHYLGVKNASDEYAVGVDLLGEAVKRDWILASSYNEFAIISEQGIMEVGAGGQYQLLDRTNRPMPNATFNALHMQQALEQMSRFNK